MKPYSNNNLIASVPYPLPLNSESPIKIPSSALLWAELIFSSPIVPINLLVLSSTILNNTFYWNSANDEAVYGIARYGTVSGNAVILQSYNYIPPFLDIVSIEKSGLKEAFYGCPDLYSKISFPELTIIKTEGMYNTFYNCDTREVSFPKLKTIESKGII